MPLPPNATVLNAIAHGVGVTREASKQVGDATRLPGNLA